MYGDLEKQETKEECKRCDVGRYSDAEGVAKTSDNVCEACVPGKYSKELGNDKDSKCKNCGSGEWSSIEAASSVDACKLCGIGRYSADVGVAEEASCKRCDLGYEQIEEGKAYCLPCTPGKFGELKDEIHICSSCLANTYSDVPEQKTSCKICANGRMSSKGAVSCSLCPVGQHVDSGGCTPCTKGTYQSGMEQATCLDCEKGKVSSNDGASMCDLCQNGNHQTKKGESVCQICDVGRFKKVQSFEGDTIDYECITCPRGRTSKTAASVCSTCSTGKMKVGNDVNSYTCIDCETGKISQAGDTSCQSCIAGLYQPNMGQGTCQPCQAGTWSSTVGSMSSLDCKACGKSTYSTAIGASNIITCNRCPPGSKGTITGASNSNVCEPCKIGKISKSGATECNNCFIGQYTAETGQASCSKCGAGKYGTDTSTGNACEKCSVGWKRAEEDIDLTKCIQCGLGEDSLEGSTSCSACGIGQYGSVAGVCTECPKGQYQSDKKQTTCLRCKDGRLPNEQATGCVVPTYRVKEDCDFVNQYLNNSGTNENDWECQPCPLGGYCEGNIDWSGVRPKYGYWRTHEAAMGNQTPACLWKGSKQNQQVPACAFEQCKS